MMSPIPEHRKRRLLATALLVYAIGWLLCLLPFFAAGLLPGHWNDDTNTIFIPYRAYLMRMVRSLNFPDLAAGQFLGQPMMTYGQPMLLYPTMLIGWFVPLSNTVFFLFDLWVHATLASLGCAWLLKKRGASTITALALGWVYPNTTAFLLRAYGHWTMVHQAALLPWVLLAWESLDRVSWSRARRPAVLFAIVVALFLLCRTPHWPYLLIVCLTPLEIWRAVRRRRLISIPRRVAVFGLAGAGALILAAPAIFPPLLGLKESFRALVAGTNFSRLWPLSPINLLGLASPYLFFGGRPDAYFGNWWPWESIAIVGRGVFVLGIVGLVGFLMRPKRMRARAALPIVLILVGLVFGMAGESTWLWKALRVLPLFDSLRAWGRASILIVLGLLLLAGPAIDELGCRTARSRFLSGTTVGICILLFAFVFWLRGRLGGAPDAAMHFLAGFGWQSHQFSGHPNALIDALDWMRIHLRWDGVAYALGAILGAGFLRLRPAASRLALKELVLFLLIIEAIVFQQFAWIPRTQPLTPETVPNVARALRRIRKNVSPAPITAAFLPHELLNYGLEFKGVRSLTGTDSNMRRSYGQWLESVEGLPPNSSQMETRIKTFPPELMDVTGLSVVVRSTNPGAPDNAKGPSYSCRVLENPMRRPYAELVGVDKSSKAGTNASVVVKSWNDDTVDLKVRATKAARLRVREFPDPRWHVTVNGRATDPEWEHHNLFIPIPAGEAEVHLEYIDLPARVSVAVSLLGWLALALVCIWIRVRRTRRT